MRPINKGDWPQLNGENVNYTEYGQARPELMNRIGDYCSYCENQITNPAVEHEQAKSVSPGIELNWYNFLLACVTCNSIKGHEYLVIDNYYWPDIHNTYLLFDFFEFGIVSVKAVLHPSINRDRANRTFDLINLGNWGETASDKDRRWIKRSEAWGKAYCLLNLYENYNRPADFISAIVNNATSTGYWSVWMKVFESHNEVQNALIIGFNGTYEACRNRNIDRL